MKIKLSLFITILLTCLLVACNSKVDNEVKATLIGTIVEINGESATVFVPEAEGSKISGPIAINLTVNADETFQVGDTVKIGYDGTTMETAPIGIKPLTLEKLAEKKK